MSTSANVALSALAILVCGGLGALAGFGAVSSLGWTGTGGAIAAAMIAMLGATLAWSLGVALLRRLGWLR